jgi:F-box and WD-40 domain protein 1/11
MAAPWRFPPVPPSPRGDSPARSSFKLDEGYSEDTRSQSGSEAVFGRQDMSRLQRDVVEGRLPEWMKHMSELERTGQSPKLHLHQNS